MADISQAANQVLADDSRLNDAMDLWPLAVPGLAGDDKATAMKTVEMAKRLRRIMINRNGAFLSADYELTDEYVLASPVLAVPMEVKTVESLVAARLNVFTDMDIYAHNNNTRLARWQVSLYRGDVEVFSSMEFRSDESPVAEDDAYHRQQGEPVLIYLLDKPGVVTPVEYRVYFKRTLGINSMDPSLSGVSPSYLNVGTNAVFEEL